MPSAIDNILAMRKDLRGLILDDFRGQVLSHDNCVRLAVSFRGLLLRSRKGFLQYFAGSNIMDRALLDTINAALKEDPVTEELADTLAWRVAGNRERLMSGRAVYPWAGLDEAEEMVPIQIVKVRPGHRKVGMNKEAKLFFGCWLKCRILAGTPAGMTVNLFWTRQQASYFARRIGFDRHHFSKTSRSTKPRYYYEDCLQLFGLRLLGQVTREKSKPESPGFETYSSNASIKKRNRKILASRARDGFKCPFEYEHPCHRCLKGLPRPGVPGCPVATHETEFILFLCPRCKTSAPRESVEDKYCILCSGLPARKEESS